MNRSWWALVLSALGALGVSSPEVAGQEPLPEGAAGLAARYPGDSKIGADPAVLFADDFEGYAAPTGLTKRWDSVHHREHIRLATRKENVFRGKQSLEFHIPRQERELANAVAKALRPKRDLVFLRYYSRFDPRFDVTGSSHNGCSISGGYYVAGRASPGIPADGKNKFLVAFENWRGSDEKRIANPGRYNIYIYHPRQRSRWGDHFFPTGLVMPNTRHRFDFGDRFVARPDLIPERGRWYCHEVMLQANDAGERTGRIACWLDGKLVADFPNLRLRDVASLKIDRVALNFHIARNPRRAASKWYDNVVVATSYIGPMK